MHSLAAHNDLVAGTVFRILGSAAIIAAWRAAMRKIDGARTDIDRATVIIVLCALGCAFLFEDHQPPADWSGVGFWLVFAPILIYVGGLAFPMSWTLHDGHVSTEDCVCLSGASGSYIMAMLITYHACQPLHVAWGTHWCIAARIVSLAPCWVFILLLDAITQPKHRAHPLQSAIHLARTNPVLRLILHPATALLALVGFFP